MGTGAVADRQPLQVGGGDAESARRELAHADHVERTWVHALFDVRVDDPSLYTVVLDASRLAPDRIVEVLLTAAGMGPAAG